MATETEALALMQKVYGPQFAQKTKVQLQKRGPVSSLDVRGTIGELVRVLKQGEKNPGVPNFERVHLFTYPERQDPVECALNAGICDGSNSTHGTAQMIFIMKLLQWDRYRTAVTRAQAAQGDQRSAFEQTQRYLKRLRILPEFVFNSIDMKEDRTRTPLIQRFQTHIANSVHKGYGREFAGAPGPHGWFILLIECGSCGDGNDLFAKETSWGHRVLLIFQYAEPKLVHHVEYYDSLGDWSLHTVENKRKKGIAISQYVLTYLVKPMLDTHSKLIIMPSVGALCLPSSSEVSVSTSLSILSDRVFVQHPDEYLCQNWVLFFADARMANISVNKLQRWFRHYRPYQGKAQASPPFGTAYAMMVLFHVFHLRRLVHFQADAFATDQQTPAHGYSVFGIKWPEMTEDMFMGFLGADWAELNTYVRQQNYMRRFPKEWTPFPADTQDFILDPLWPLMNFVKRKPMVFTNAGGRV